MNRGNVRWHLAFRRFFKGNWHGAYSLIVLYKYASMGLTNCMYISAEGLVPLNLSIVASNNEGQWFYDGNSLNTLSLAMKGRSSEFIQQY